MKKLFLICVFMFLFAIQILPQNWPTAPEVWSEPVLFDSILSRSYECIESSSLTPNFDTIYFSTTCIYRSVKVNGKWSKSVKLNSYINPPNSGVRDCSISRDGRRLYFSGYGGYGSWDLWYSNLDSVTNDWGPGYNMGPQINSSGNDAYIYEVNKDTLYVLQNITSLNYYSFNKKINQWCKIDSFPHHPLGGPFMFGVNLTKDKKKMYFGIKRFNEWSLDLCVCYWDTTINYWGNVYYLNTNTERIKVGNTYKRGEECYPWISEDGKKLVFASNRDVSLHPDSSNYSTLYISYLLIDENGDTVTSVDKNETPAIKSFTLEQNYPNPFNPNTIIKYTIAKEGNIKIIVYDSIGRKITELVNDYKNEGQYQINFETQKYKLASGVYYYQLICGENYLVKKMILSK